MSLPSDDDNVTPEPFGFGAAPSWFIRDPRVSPTAKLVYLVLSTYTGKTNVVFPSQDTIAEQACVSVPTVKRAIAELRGLGIIKVQVQRTGRGRRNLYELTIHPFGGGGGSS